MATLVLSTVGTMLGGPVGGAIGALIGQSIDQELLAPRGPRLGDLGVQSSTYGTQIPRIYGTMRVAGSVVWATDLVQSEATTGAKGQPDATQSYSVSFAVALSSRSVTAIKRIWADGKLLRGIEGDFKVSTTFRFYAGSEAQVIDPLIGSIEGNASTPAYRGLALAVFENLELAEFGNRIPFLTFEVEADETALTIASIAADASGGAIACEAVQAISGYAAYGQSIKAAIEPLIESYGIELFDDGLQLRSPLTVAPHFIRDSELGNSSDHQPAARIEREQLASRRLPAQLRLTYYDPARDYQSGEARASASEQRGNEVQRELPAVVGADSAKALVQQMLARNWGSRDKLTLRLAPGHLALEPGSRIELALSPKRWIIDKCTIDGFVIVTELRPDWSPAAAISADAGRIAANADIVAGNLSLALLDVPDVLGQSSEAPTLLLAASTATPGWEGRTVEIDAAGQTFSIRTARRKSVLGSAVDVLTDAETNLIDTSNTVEITLIDPDQWLTSCDDEALINGANLAVLGSELIQFGSAVPTGSGRFLLSRLLRGRAGTEWASSTHIAGETFVLIDRNALSPVSLPAWISGSTATARAVQRDGPPPTNEMLVSGESVRPPAPVALTASVQPNGDLAVSWTRRSRRGWSWIDEVDAPLGEAREAYRVSVTGSAGAIEVECGEAELTIAASSLAPVGTGPASIAVRQIGDLAVSRPAQTTVIL